MTAPSIPEAIGETTHDSAIGAKPFGEMPSIAFRPDAFVLPEKPHVIALIPFAATPMPMTPPMIEYVYAMCCTCRLAQHLRRMSVRQYKYIVLVRWLYTLR